MAAFDPSAQRPALDLAVIENRLSLREQVGIATTVLCFALVAVLALAASHAGRNQARQLVGNEMAELARTVADRLDRSMSGRFQDAELMAELDPLRDVWEGPAFRVRIVLDEMRERIAQAAWISFATPSGYVKSATDGVFEGRLVADMPWFVRGREGIVAEDVHEMEQVARQLGIPPETSLRFVSVAAPVSKADGTLAGVLGIHLSWQWARDVVSSTLAALDPAKQTDIWILSEDGMILLGPREGAKAFAPARFADLERNGAGYFTDHDGEAALTGFAVTQGAGEYPGLGWVVIARRPAAIAFAPADNVAWAIVGWGLVVGLAGIAVAMVIAGRVSRPIRTLTAEADQIGRDPTKLMIPHVSGSVEVSQLSTALRSLLRRIDLTEEELAADRKRADEETRKLNENIESLKELADTDPLTGLPNRRGMVRFSADVMSDYSRQGARFSVLVIDIDHFKRVNDTFGHAVGDEVIVHVARIVEGSIRPSDRVARFGGEEFVAVLRGSPLLRAGELAERIRAMIEASPAHAGQAIPVTVSIGVAIVSPEDRDVQDVIERADLALYDAKTAGRNRISLRAAQPQSGQAA
jgi:diguanylate cyclase (GGDEF)-like protein